MRCILQPQLQHLVLSNDSRNSHHLQHYKNLQPGYNPQIKSTSELNCEGINKYKNAFVCKQTPTSPPTQKKSPYTIEIVLALVCV